MRAALLGLLALVAVDAHSTGHPHEHSDDDDEFIIDFGRPIERIDEFCQMSGFDETACMNHDCCVWEDIPGDQYYGRGNCFYCKAGGATVGPQPCGGTCGFDEFCKKSETKNDCESQVCCEYKDGSCSWDGDTSCGTGSDLQSPFPVYKLADEKSAASDDCVFPVYKLSDDKSAASDDCGPDLTLLDELENSGFDKVMCPFGVLIVGSARYPENNLKFAANVLAQLLDPDEDGVPDSREVQKALTFGSPTAPVFVCASNDEEDIAGRHVFIGHVGYAFSSFQNAGTPIRNEQTLMHELHHLVHQQGWAYVWPDVFGHMFAETNYMGDDDDGDDDELKVGWDSSVICDETARHQCTNPGWHHDENTCPNGDDLPPGHPEPSPLKGTCEPVSVCGGGPQSTARRCHTPDCDCVEFHREAALTWAGQYDGPVPVDSFGKYMPPSSSAIKKMLSDEYQNVLSNKTYAQVQKPLTGEYKLPTGQALAARLSDEDRVKDTVLVKTSTLVAVCVLAGVALGGVLTLLAKESKAKEPTEREPLLAKA